MSDKAIKKRRIERWKLTQLEKEREEKVRKEREEADKKLEDERYDNRDFNKGRHPAICRRFKRVKSPVRLLETKICFH